MEIPALSVPTLADLERAPGFRVQRRLSDRLNFVVAGDEGGRAELYGKVYERDGLVSRLRKRRGARPGVDEAALLSRLAAEGLPVPAVAAAGALPSGRSYVVVRAVEGVPLDDALRAGRFAAPAERRRLVRALARLVRRLHETGTVHRDLYLCHVLVSPSGCRLSLIDFERALARRRARWRVKDVAALLSSVPEGFLSRTDAVRFLLEYRGGAEGLRRFARRVARKAAKLRAHAPRPRRSSPASALLAAAESRSA